MKQNVEVNVKVFGLDAIARQYVGIGPMNVSTPRGEVKANTGDYILKVMGEVFIVHEELFLRIAEESANGDLEVDASLASPSGSTPVGSSGAESTEASGPASTDSTSSSQTPTETTAEKKARLLEEQKTRILTAEEQIFLIDA